MIGGFLGSQVSCGNSAKEMLKLPHKQFSVEMKLWMLYSAQRWLDGFESAAIGSGNMDSKESERIIKNWIKSSGYGDVSIPSNSPRAKTNTPSSSSASHKKSESSTPGGKKETNSFNPMAVGFDSFVGLL